MSKANHESGDWSTVRPHLANWGKPALLSLVKDLYAASEVGRDLVNARCRPAATGEALLEKYRRKIVEQFFPARGFGKLRLGEARKAIRDYRKATGNISGTAELLMTYVENGADFTHQFGDIDERFYNSVESALNELAALLRGEARSLYAQLEDRLANVEQKVSGIGWGFGDCVSDVIAQLYDDLGESDALVPKPPPKQ